MTQAERLKQLDRPPTIDEIRMMRQELKDAALPSPIAEMLDHVLRHASRVEYLLSVERAKTRELEHRIADISAI